EQGYLFQGNNLRINMLPEGGPLLEVAQGHAANCGWAWGAQFVDLDLDGWQDLFVANGFVSAEPDTSYWYDMGKVGGATGSLVEDASHWPAMNGRSLSGYERSRVLRNINGRGFRDVGQRAGITDTFDGRAVAVADLFADGAPDVLVANQGGPLLLYSNEPAAGMHWIAFDLVASSGHPEALGATLSARFGPDHVQRLVKLSANGFCAQNGPYLQLGLGPATQVDELSIRWPSGKTQVLKDLPADQRHRIVEPD
ncbi:MAG: CRTAC1 family protein, partial [Planctomycetota bacterium]